MTTRDKCPDCGGEQHPDICCINFVTEDIHCQHCGTFLMTMAESRAAMMESTRELGAMVAERINARVVAAIIGQ